MQKQKTGVTHNQLLELLSKHFTMNTIGLIASKEENLHNMATTKEEMQRQDQQVNLHRSNTQAAGTAIAESINSRRITEAETREAKMKEERLERERETQSYIENIKQTKKLTKQEFEQLCAEVLKSEKELQDMKLSLSQQKTSQDNDLKQRDETFTKEMNVKIQIVEELRRKLEELKKRSAESKKKLEELEALEGDISTANDKLILDLEKMDDELDKLDDKQDDVLLSEKLQKDVEQIRDALAKLEKEQKELERRIKEQEELRDRLKNQVKDLLDETKKLEPEESEDIDSLQKKLLKAQDDEKKSIDENMKLQNDLRDIEEQNQKEGDEHSKLQSQAKHLGDSSQKSEKPSINFAERKLRSLENLLRQFEDKIREKRKVINTLNMKVDRLESTQPQEIMESFGLLKFRDSLVDFEKELKNLEKMKDDLRSEKQKLDDKIKGKEASEIDKDTLAYCVNGANNIEKSLDVMFQKENDVYNVDRFIKTFNNIEKEMSHSYLKKCKDLQEDEQTTNTETAALADDILVKVCQIELEVIPHVAKIADDEDEIETLNGKIDIMKGMKRDAAHITEVDLDEVLVPKIDRIRIKDNDLYELIEQYKELVELEGDVKGVEKHANQLKKRLYDFDQGIRQFQTELKFDYYEDAIKDFQLHQEKLKVYDDLLHKLGDGIKEVEDVLAQSEQGGDKELQNNLKELKEMRSAAEKDKADMQRQAKVIDGEIKAVDLNRVTPEELENLEQSIVKHGENLDDKKKHMDQATNNMKTLQQEASSLEYKNKADKRQGCKQKLKQIEQNVDDLDRVLEEINNALEMIEKDAQFVKRSNIQVHKHGGDKQGEALEDVEKTQELAKQNKEIAHQKVMYDDLVVEKNKLQSELQTYQKKFDSMPLEQTSFQEFDTFIDNLNKEILERSETARKKAKNQLEVDLKNLKEVMEALIEKYKQKKSIMFDCRKEETEKTKDIHKAEQTIQRLANKPSLMEKELVSQQSANLNAEKKKKYQDLLDDIHRMKNEISKYNNEIETEKTKLKDITKSMYEIGERVVTLDDLKQIYKQLTQMTRLKVLLEELRALNEELENKEHDVEQFIKDLLGGNIYECERKLKEAETVIVKLTTKEKEIDGAINDFEKEVKNGLPQFGNDEEMKKEGKKILDANDYNKKELKETEEQTQFLKKVLQKIKGSIDESNNKKNNQLTSGMIEQYISEIDTCLQKGDIINGDLEKIDTELENRKEQWNDLLYKRSAKDHLVQNMERAILENLNAMNELQQRLDEIDKLLSGLKVGYTAMIDNPDYQVQQQQIKKQLGSLTEAKAQRNHIQQEMEKLGSFITEQQAAQKNGLMNMKVEELEYLAKENVEKSDLLNKENKAAEAILRELQKKRQKLGDADIMDNFKDRVDKLQQIDTKLKQVDKEHEDLVALKEKIASANADQALTKYLKESKEEILEIIQIKMSLQKQLDALKETLHKKELNKEDPSTMPPLINELKDIRKALDARDDQLNKIGQHLKFLKNKHGGIDLETKINQFKIDSNNMKEKLGTLSEELEILKYFHEEFDGYTSDNEEEDFVEKLGVDIHELTQKLGIATDENEKIIDQVQSAAKGIQRSKNKDDLSSKEIEERAKMTAQIEEDLLKLSLLVNEIGHRISKNSKYFNAMNIKDKLRRRVQEANELSKRLESFQNQVSEIQVDIKNEYNKLHLADEKDQKIGKTYEGILSQLEETETKYDQIGQILIAVDSDLADLLSATCMSQLDLLKGNVRNKKKIRIALEEVKEIRTIFMQLKTNFETIKLQNQKPVYKAKKGDNVDELLGDWVNNHGCPVPIKRIGDGQYMFGTKKIYAKIINGKLVIRVGGGYMSVDEFMFYYGAQELNKMIASQDAVGSEEVDIGKALDDNKTDIIRETTDGKGVIGIAQMKKRFSPRASSPTSSQQSYRTITTTTTVKKTTTVTAKKK